MSRKRFTTEQIIHKLRQAEVEIAKGKLVPEACKQIGVVEQTFYRWRKKYGPMQPSEIKCQGPGKLVHPQIGQTSPPDRAGKAAVGVWKTGSRVFGKTGSQPGQAGPPPGGGSITLTSSSGPPAGYGTSSLPWSRRSRGGGVGPWPPRP